MDFTTALLIYLGIMAAAYVAGVLFAARFERRSERLARKIYDLRRTMVMASQPKRSRTITRREARAFLARVGAEIGNDDCDALVVAIEQKLDAPRKELGGRAYSDLTEEELRDLIAVPPAHK